MTLLTLHDRVINTWNKIPFKWQLELTSAFYTFATATVIEAGVQYHLYGDAGPTSAGVLLAVGIACLRAGFKALGSLLFCEVSNWLATKKRRYE